MIRVDLDKLQELTALTTAYRRTVENSEKVDQSIQKVNIHEDVARNGEAAGAEIALAKYYGKPDFTPTIGTFKQQADLGSSFEVKWTKWKEGHLIIKPSDRNTDIAVLVVGTSPTYFIAGWIPIAIAKSARFKDSRSESWWVGQQDLAPIENLIRSKYADACTSLSNM